MTQRDDLEPHFAGTYYVTDDEFVFLCPGHPPLWAHEGRLIYAWDLAPDPNTQP